MSSPWAPYDNPPREKASSVTTFIPDVHYTHCLRLDFLRKRKNKGFNWSPLWALSLTLKVSLCHVQTTHICFHSVGFFPAHISASKAVSQRGEKCLRIKLKMVGPGYMKMAFFVNPHEMPWKRIQYVICFWKTRGNEEMLIILRYFERIFQYFHGKAKGGRTNK